MKDELINQVVNRKIASKEEAEREYERFTKEAEKQFSFLKPEQRQERIEIMFANYFKALAKTDLQTFEGVILKSSGQQFITKRRIAKIMRQYNEDPQKVIDEGKIIIENGQPIAVDSIKYFHEGKPNQRENRNYGKPLNENSVQKSVEGIFMYEGQEKKFTLMLRDDFVYNTKIPLIKPIRMKVALGGSIDNETIRLIPRRGSKFEIMEDKNINIQKLVEKHYSNDMVEIAGIEQSIANAENKFSLQKLIKGQILELNLTPNANGSGSFRLMEESVDFDKNFDCRVKIPEEWLETIDYGEFSTVYVLGSPWVLTPDNQNKVIGMTALGIYPIFKSKPTKETNGVKESDVNGNGEVPKQAEEFKDFNKIDDKMFK